MAAATRDGPPRPSRLGASSHIGLLRIAPCSYRLSRHLDSLPRLSRLTILIRHQTDPSSRTAACRLTLRASSVMPSSSSPVFIAVAVYKRVCGMPAVCLPAQRTQRKKRRTTSARSRDDASDAMSRNSRSGTPSIRRLVRYCIVQPLSMPAFWSCT